MYSGYTLSMKAVFKTEIHMYHYMSGPYLYM